MTMKTGLGGDGVGNSQPTYPVKLTHLECVYLSDSISMFMQGPPDALPGESSPYPNLLIKLGGAVLETDQHNNKVTVYVSVSELWMIREVAKSSVVVGSERVGLSLLLKVYAGIRALTAEDDMMSIVKSLGEVIDSEPGKSEYVAKLERIKGGGDFTAGGKPNDEPNRNSGDDNAHNADKGRPNH